eukprot:1335959-Pyramimonas_sp.AAC.1
MPELLGAGCTTPNIVPGTLRRSSAAVLEVSKPINNAPTCPAWPQTATWALEGPKRAPRGPQKGSRPF